MNFIPSDYFTLSGLRMGAVWIKTRYRYCIMKYTASQQRPEAGTVPVSPRPVSQLGAVPGRHPGQSHPQPGKSKSIVKVNYDLCPKHELHIDHCRSPHCTQHIYNYTHSRELRNASVGANTPIYTSPNIFR